MNDFNRNTRTLIVSFVVAIFALVPLRFVEAGQGMELQQSVSQQVLGESVEITPEVSQQRVLEEPYNELENNICIKKTELKKIEKLVMDKLLDEKLSAEDKSNMLNALKDQEMSVCKY